MFYRSNRDGSQIAEYLSAHGIPVQSSESLLIDSSRAVRVLVAALRTLAFPDDLQARATLANYLEEKGAFSAQDPDAKKAGSSPPLQRLSSKPSKSSPPGSSSTGKPNSFPCTNAWNTSPRDFPCGDRDRMPT